MSGESKKHRMVFLVAVLPALVFQLIGAYFYFVVFADSSSVPMIFTLIKVAIFAWPVVWYFVGFKPASMKSEGQNILSVGLGITTGLLAAITVVLFALLFHAQLVHAAPAIMEKVNAFGIAKYYIPFALFLSLAHAALEEYYWRWFVFGGLAAHIKPRTAAIISSVAFSSHHFIVLSQFVSLPLAIAGTIGVGIAGYVWCMLYERSGNLKASWISHVLADMAVMALGYVLLF